MGKTRRNTNQFRKNPRNLSKKGGSYFEPVINYVQQHPYQTLGIPIGLGALGATGYGLYKYFYNPSSDQPTQLPPQPALVTDILPVLQADTQSIPLPVLQADTPSTPLPVLSINTQSTPLPVPSINTQLISAIINNNLENVKILINQGADVNAKDNS